MSPFKDVANNSPAYSDFIRKLTVYRDENEERQQAALATLIEDWNRWSEAEIVRMLGCWVSGLEPVLVFHAGHLVGLTIADLPLNVVAPIVVRARPYPPLQGARHG